MESSLFDIAIVGGGPVGSTLAAALRDSGLSVAVLDPRPPLSAGGDGRSFALAAGSARLYQYIGLWDDAVARHATPIESVHVSDRGHFGFTRFAAAECGLDALGHVVAARDLALELDAALTGAPRVERVVASLTAIHPRDDRVELELDAAAAPDGSARLEARLVVGADGADSAVRRGAGVGLREYRCDQIALAGEFTPERAHRGRSFERLTKWGPLAVLPHPEERCGFVWTVPQMFADKLSSPTALEDALSRAFGTRLGALQRIELRARAPLRICHARRVTAPRIALIGNAANTLHPVGAQGLNLGLRDAHALAGRLSAVARREHDPATALKGYAAARRADHCAARLFTMGMLRVASSRVPPLPALGALGRFALDRAGPAKRGFARALMGVGPATGRTAHGI